MDHGSTARRIGLLRTAKVKTLSPMISPRNPRIRTPSSVFTFAVLSSQRKSTNLITIPLPGSMPTQNILRKRIHGSFQLLFACGLDFDRQSPRSLDPQVSGFSPSNALNSLPIVSFNL